MRIKLKRLITVAMVVAFGLAGVTMPNAWADAFSGFTMSPMTQLVVLDPGDSYDGQLSVSNPANNTLTIDYEVSVRSFYRDEDNNAIFEDVDGYGQMADWITITSPMTGEIAPNETDQISYRINVPENAPAGGQYASITVTTVPPESDAEGETAILKESIAMAYVIYAEITGDTVHSGEVISADVPGFMFSGNITGTAAIKNTGNVHGAATYKMQVFPLFSSEEVFTNEEEPMAATILPNRTRYVETVWEQTPPIGIFNVIYTVEFEGITTQVSKMVIICPIWLLFIIIFAVIMLILWIVLRTKKRGKAKKSPNSPKPESATTTTE